MLIGDSSSGKTVLAFQVAQRRKQAGWTAHYANMANMPLIPSGMVQELLFPQRDRRIETGDEIEDRSDNALLIADDLQSRPLVSKLLLATASVDRKSTRLNSSH